MQSITFIILISFLSLISCEYFTKHYKKLPLSSQDTYIGLLPHQRLFPSKYSDTIRYMSNPFPISYEKFNSNLIMHKMLGDGASAEVYLVEDMSTSQFKVLKVYAENQNFELQNYIMRTLEYKVNWSICPLSNQTLAIYDQFENSKNLSDIRFKERQVKILMYKLVKELQKAHEKGIIHSDIKAHNILIDGKLVKRKYISQKTKVQIIDWNAGQLYFMGKRLMKHQGTREYMSPEILINSRYYSPAIDVWSLGVLMFRIVSRQSLMKQPQLPIKNLIKLFGYDKVKQFYERICPEYDTEVAKQFLEFKDIEGQLLSKLLAKKMTEEQIEFVKKMLVLEPQERPTLGQLINDPYFSDVPNFKNPGYYKEAKKAGKKKDQ